MYFLFGRATESEGGGWAGVNGDNFKILFYSMYFVHINFVPDSAVLSLRS